MIKLLSCPFHTIRKTKRRYDGAYVGDVNEVQNFFSILELVKEPLTIIFALGMMFISVQN
jgi:hypothetical protein